MLTKDLLCFRTKSGKIYPKFIDPKNEIILKFAFELTELFSSNIGEKRETLENRSKIILEGLPLSVVVGRGLEKLLIDRTEFDTEIKNEVLALREKVFKNSSTLMQSNAKTVDHNSYNSSIESLKSYRSDLAASLGFEPENLTQLLYADLPPFQKVLKFRKINEESLLHRYNCAQVQGLLLRSDSIKLNLRNISTASMRQLLKFLRFNKLLAKISFEHQKSKSLQIVIDGPLSLFMHTHKYGLNLANFFPAVLHQSNWKLDATVRINKNKSYVMQLDHSCGIKSHFNHFLAYVPEEIQKLSQQLTKKMPDWKLTSSNEFLQLPGENLCFPDYIFKHISGKKVPVELFHKWHSGPLINRISQLDEQKDEPLIIGINRSLLKNVDLANKLDSSKYFSQFGFIFKDIPTVTTLLPRLESWLRSRI